MKHKVLIATYYWPPSGGPGVQRYLKFAKYLPDFEIEPIVLTVKNPTYPIRDVSLIHEVPKELKVYKSKTVEPFRFYAKMKGQKAESIKPTVEIAAESFSSSIGSWIRANLFIPDARAGWLLTARPRAEGLVKKHRIQTVITTGPPHSVHFIGKHLQEKYGIRWLADFRDPWTQVYYNQLLPRTGVAEQIDEKLEHAILKEADEVIVVSPSQAENFRKICERGYRVITNGFDPADFESLDADSGKKEKVHDLSSDTEIPVRPDKIQTPVETSGARKGKAGLAISEATFLIRHVGNISESAVPEPFLQVIRKMAGRHNLKLEFIGDVHQRLISLVDELELASTVSIKPYQPHLVAMQMMREADLLLLSIPDVDQIQHHIPGKLFEYLGSGRPVLMLGPVDGDSARILQDEQSGLACDFHDEKAIKHALQQFIDGKFQLKPITDLKSHPYSRRTLTKNLSELILMSETL